MEIAFYESQKFRKPWIWILFILLLAGFIWEVKIVLYYITSFQVSVLEKLFLFFRLLIVILIAVLLIIVKLEVEINEKALLYRFFPFQIRKRVIEWKEVEKAYIRQYKPIMEYGGWGIRFSLKRGRAYNISGNIGLQIEFKNGKKILFGTHKNEEIENIIDLLAREKIIEKSELNYEL